MSYSFEISWEENPEHICHLKNSIPDKVEDSCCISEIVRTEKGG